MNNSIPLGLFATLNRSTRILSRNHDGKSVILPASAARCLYKLTEAQGQVLSQTQLMEIGWREAGFAATNNSVRVMISKLRRALASLDLDHHINLLAVSRSGYRLVIHASPSEELTPGSPPLRLIQTGCRPCRWKRVLSITGGGIAAGIAAGLIAQYFFLLTPKEVNFVHWRGEAVPAGSRVWVPENQQTQHELIDSTLLTYMRYVLGPDQSAAKELYITIGAIASPHHQGIIACQQPLQEASNACESYYFRIH